MAALILKMVFNLIVYLRSVSTILNKSKLLYLNKTTKKNLFVRILINSFIQKYSGKRSFAQILIYFVSMNNAKIGVKKRVFVSMEYAWA